MTDTTPQPQLWKFFGDAEHAFALTPPFILELERATGAGIGKLCSRLFDRAFDYKDVTETIRLALIGGGMDPKRATEMIETYVAGRPLIFGYEIAVAVLEHAWFGPQTNEDTDAAH
jgi:hypothetical protein